MTSERQFAANRRNARKSCGPKSEAGKRRSRMNAICHGLTAETVIGPLERVGDYQSFEAAITAEYIPKTTVEQELVLRLASLLWRLRRAIAVETGLLEIHAKTIEERRVGSSRASSDSVPDIIHRILGRRTSSLPSPDASQHAPGLESHSRKNEPKLSMDIARCFLRLMNVSGDVFERIGRYEASLWRQASQTLIILESARLRLRVNS